MKLGICSAYSLRNLTGHDVLIWDRPAHNWDLAQPDNQRRINALTKVHEQNAAGPAQVLFDLWAAPGATQFTCRCDSQSGSGAAASEAGAAIASIGNNGTR